MNDRLKVCPLCLRQFDTWHPVEYWARETCAGGLTHYEHYNRASLARVNGGDK